MAVAGCTFPKFSPIQAVVVIGVKGELTDWQFEILHDGKRIFEYSFQDQDQQRVSNVNNNYTQSIGRAILEVRLCFVCRSN